MAQELVTFGDIIDAICEQIGVQTSDTRAVNKIKRFINMKYHELVTSKRWTWLEKTTQIVHDEYYSTGTVALTAGSASATLSASPSVSLGSFKNYRFSPSGNNTVYTVLSHTAGSASLTLTTAYQEDTNATAGYKIWRDRIDLPTEAKETIEIWHSERTKPLDAIGSQGFRRLEAKDPKAEGCPEAYNTWDFFNPNDPDPEVDADRYRQTRIYPSITDHPIVLNVDYIQKAGVLENDDDEPIIPLEDRIVLYYGAGALAWAVIARNEEMKLEFERDFKMKWAQMSGERDDGFDTPSLKPKSSYVNSIRRSGLRRTW